MATLGAMIAATQQEWRDDVVHPPIFATANPDEISAAVNALCVRVLGVSIRRYRFFVASVGSVHGGPGCSGPGP